jgi:putative ABC transport system permease protein
MSRWQPFRTLFGLVPKDDVDHELTFHLEMRTREFVERGESPERARQLALERFGDVERSRLECVAIGERRGYQLARARYLSELRQDIAYGLRMLRRAPGFTAVAVLTMALGVGANSTVFSVVHGVLVRSLPFPEADRLYRLRMIYPDGSAYSTFSAPDFMSVRADTRVFEDVQAYTGGGAVTMLGVGEPSEVRVASVSDGLLRLLDIPVVIGRRFSREEHQLGRNGVALLDHAFWQRAFGGDLAAIGRQVTIGGIGYTVVGVIAPGVRLPADVPGTRVPSEADVYLPLEYGPPFSATAAAGRRSNYLAVLARARTGITVPQIDEDMRRIATSLQATFPATNEGLSMNAIAAHELIVGDVRRPLLILLGAVGFVLLVACTNLAHLMLARASTRQTELAVRAALGAGRGRLVRQLLTEATVLGLLGGVAGLVLAYLATETLVAARPADIPRLDEITVDGTVVLFTLGLALVAGLAFGVLPALQASGHRIWRGLRGDARTGGADRQTQRVRAALVVAEVALAVVLLTGAGLLVRSFLALTRVDPAFVADRAMAFRITLFGRGYDTATVLRRVTSFEASLGALPGVTAVAATSVLPMRGPGPRRAFSVEGVTPPANVNPEIGVLSVTPGYFQAIGASLLRGRSFTEGDGPNTPAVAIINSAGARRWFAEGSVIGRRVDADGLREIVGVVADVGQGHPGEPVAPQLFVPYHQRPSRSVWIVVRSSGNRVALAADIRTVIRAADPNLAIADFTPLDQLVSDSLARPRFYTLALTLFAAVALALAAIGIFGVTSYTVAERAREVGIRIALGAHPPAVVRAIVGRTLTLAALGTGIGVVVALVAGRVLQNQLFGVTLVDPVTLIAVTATLIASAMVASFLPAWRIVKLDPGSALRQS